MKFSMISSIRKQWFFFIPLMHCLRIRSSALQVYLIGIKIQQNVIERLYHSLDFAKPAGDFLSLFLENPAFPFKYNLQDAILNADEKYHFDQLDKLEMNIRNLKIPRDSVVEFAPLFHPIVNINCPFSIRSLGLVEALPSSSRLQQLSAQHLLLIIKSTSKSPNLLSTRNLCNSLTEEMLLEDSFEKFLQDQIWRLLDSHCLVENQDIAQIMYGQFLFPDNMALDGMNGLEPIARLLQCIAIRIMVANDKQSGFIYNDYDQTLKEMIGDELGVIYEQFNAVIKKISISDPLFPLYQRTSGYMSMFAQRAYDQPSINKLSSDHYFEELWSIFVDRAKPSIQTNRALINILILLSGSHTYLEWMKEDVEWILSGPSNLFPRKELFHLLILLCRHLELLAAENESQDFKKLYHDIIELIWNKGLAPIERQDKLLQLYPQYFGYLYHLLDSPNKRRATFRSIFLQNFQLNTLENISIEQLWIEISRICDFMEFEGFSSLPFTFKTISNKKRRVKEMLDLLLENYFILFDGKFQDQIACYLPCVELHPYIEFLFWSLIEHTIVLNMHLPFTIHPKYVEYIFCHQEEESTDPDKIVHLIVATQLALNNVKLLKGAKLLDVMYARIWSDDSDYLDPTYHDFEMINQRSVNYGNAFFKIFSDLFSDNEHVLEKQHTDSLKFMAFSVWSSKKRKVVRRLPSGSISDSFVLTSLLFPVTATIPRSAFEMLASFKASHSSNCKDIR